MKKFIIVIFLLISTMQIALCQFNIDHLLRSGLQDLLNDKYFDAIKKFNTILEVKPNNWEAIYLRGIAKFYLGDSYGAQTDFTEGIKINSVFSEFYLLRGGTYQMQNDFAKAMKDYDEAESLDPANPSIYVNKGLIYAIQGDFDIAIDLLSRALSIKKDFAEPYLYRGFCYTEIKDFDRAAKDINKAISINRFDDRAFIWRGKMQFDKGEFQFAIDDFSRALAIAPENALTYFYRAITYHEIQKYDNAIADLDSALKINPNNDLALYNRALIYNEIGASNQAIADLQKLLSFKPNNLLARFNKASIHLERKEYREAIAELDKLISLYPDFVYAYLYRAQAKFSMGNQQGAISDQIRADNIRKQNDGNEFGDTTQFKQLVKFDADFVKDGDRELLLIGSITAKESTSAYQPDYYFMLSDINQSAVYYSEYLNKLNNVCRIDNYHFIANNVDSTDQNYIHLVDSILNNTSLPLATQYLLSGTAEALKDNYNSAAETLSKLITIENLAAAFVNRAWVNCKVIDMLRSFDETPQEISIISKSLAFDTKVKATQTTSFYNYNEVIDDLNRAIELEPKLYYAYFNRGNVLCRMQNFHEAIADYNRAIEFNNDFSEAYVNRGLTYMKLNDTANACINLSKAGELGIDEVYPILRKYCK